MACKRELADVAMAMLDLDVVACRVSISNADDRSPGHRTPLDWACETSLVEVALRLLRCEGVRDTLSVANKHGDTPLMVACKRGLTCSDVAMAMLDLDAGACCITTRDRDNHTARAYVRPSEATVQLSQLATMHI